MEWHETMFKCVAFLEVTSCVMFYSTQDGFIWSEHVVTYAEYEKALQHSARIGIYNLCSNITNPDSSTLGEFNIIVHCMEGKHT